MDHLFRYGGGSVICDFCVHGFTHQQKKYIYAVNAVCNVYTVHAVEVYMKHICPVYAEYYQNTRFLDIDGWMSWLVMG